VTENQDQETPHDKLINIEWDLINELKQILKQPNISVADKIKAANSIAYHTSVLNKLLSKATEEEPEEEAVTLGNLARNFTQGPIPKICRRREIYSWKRRSSLKR